MFGQGMSPDPRNATALHKVARRLLPASPGRTDGGCRPWFGALLALRTKALNSEKRQAHGQRESIPNDVRECLPALRHQGGKEGSY